MEDSDDYITKEEIYKLMLAIGIILLIVSVFMAGFKKGVENEREINDNYRNKYCVCQIPTENGMELNLSNINYPINS